MISYNAYHFFLYSHAQTDYLHCMVHHTLIHLFICHYMLRLHLVNRQGMFTLDKIIGNTMFLYTNRYKFTTPIYNFKCLAGGMNSNSDSAISFYNQLKKTHPSLFYKHIELMNWEDNTILVANMLTLNYPILN